MSDHDPTSSEAAIPRPRDANTGVCDLCGLRLPKRPPQAEIKGKALSFCCVGCRHVYSLLADGGFLEGDFKQSEIYKTSLRLGIIANPGQPDKIEEPAMSDLAGTKEIVFHVEGMWCSACSWLIEKVLKAENGVVRVTVIFVSDTVKIDYRPEIVGTQRLIDVINSLGYNASMKDEATGERSKESTNLLIRMGIALFLLMNVMFFSYVLYVGYFQEIAREMRFFIPVILLVLTTPAVLWCGFPIHQKAYRSIMAGFPTMEVLFSLSIFSAFFYSCYALIRGYDHYYFDTATGLVTLLLVGKFIETAARQKAVEGVNRLYRMLPKKVRLKIPDGERLVAVDLLHIGAHFLVKSGEKIPVDGRVVWGEARVDESLITGESVPISKHPGDEVIGSSLNTGGVLEIEATRIGEGTVLSNIIRLIESALSKKSPLERTVDQIARFFIPSVLALAIGTVFFLSVSGIDFESALLRGITVLVIACPCALGIATPLAIAAGIGFASNRGILIRDAEALHLSSRISAILFDKTGTLTFGKHTLIEFTGDDSALQLIASIEQFSNHPLAQAIMAACGAKDLPRGEVSGINIEEGAGIEGYVRLDESASTQVKVLIGNENFLIGRKIEISDEYEAFTKRETALGRTVIYAWIEGRDKLYQLSFGDRIRTEAKPAVADLIGRGIEVQIISGDSNPTTAAIARQLGISHYFAEALPEKKIQAIADLQKRGEVTAMVGDGVNDAPALAQADVGIAMGSGTDFAIESAPIILLRDDLTLVGSAIELSRRTIRVIKQNLTWAFLYNSVGIIAAISGLLNPLWAAAAMLVSSLTVVGNSLRLRGEKGEAIQGLLHLLVPWRETEIRKKEATVT